MTIPEALILANQQVEQCHARIRFLKAESERLLREGRMDERRTMTEQYQLELDALAQQKQIAYYVMLEYSLPMGHG